MKFQLFIYVFCKQKVNQILPFLKAGNNYFWTGHQLERGCVSQLKLLLTPCKPLRDVRGAMGTIVDDTTGMQPI